MNIVKLIATFLFFTHVTKSAELSLSELPSDVLTHIVERAYVNYKDPVDFIYLEKVSKAFHTIVNALHFVDNCKTKGFVAPALMFYSLSTYESDDNDIIKKDLIATNGKLRLTYYAPETVQQNLHRKGLFYCNSINLLAIWVNPKNTEVFNQYLACDTVKCEQSKMSLARYMAEYAKGERIKEKDSHGLFVRDPITAKIKIITVSERTNNKLYEKFTCKNYDNAQTEIESPVRAQRFVTKCPPTIEFKGWQSTTEFKGWR